MLLCSATRLCLGKQGRQAAMKTGCNSREQQPQLMDNARHRIDLHYEPIRPLFDLKRVNPPSVSYGFQFHGSFFVAAIGQTLSMALTASSLPQEVMFAAAEAADDYISFRWLRSGSHFRAYSRPFPQDLVEINKCHTIGLLSSQVPTGKGI